MALSNLDTTFPQENFPTGVCGGDSFALNNKILAAAHDAIDTAQNADLVFRVKNSDRSVGATVAGMIAKLYGREGMPNQKKIKVRLEGEAGQSLGAWCINGLDLELRGFAQDGVVPAYSWAALRGRHPRLHRERLRRRDSERRRKQRRRWSHGRHGVHWRSRRSPPRHPQLGRDDRGRGRREVCLRVHDSRPRADSRAGRERDRFRDDGRRVVRLRPEDGSAREVARQKRDRDRLLTRRLRVDAPADSPVLRPHRQPSG
ncbi:MAG: hypothetical protein U0792_17820 [Gemmataceae bacterium]